MWTGESGYFIIRWRKKCVQSFTEQRGGRTVQISRHYLALRRMLWRHFSAEALGTRVNPSSETQGQLVEAGKSLNGREKNSGEEKFSSPAPEFFSRPFRLFPAPTNCPWVSEDGVNPDTIWISNSRVYLSVIVKIPVWRSSHWYIIACSQPPGWWEGEDPGNEVVQECVVFAWMPEILDTHAVWTHELDQVFLMPIPPN